MRCPRSALGTLGLTAAIAASMATTASVTAGAPGFAWVRQFGTSAAEAGIAVAVDAARNVYVVGCTNGALPGQSNKGGEDAFVRKLRSAGARPGPASSEAPFTIAPTRSRSTAAVASWSRA